MPTIMGHTLSRSQVATLDALTDYLRAHGGDTGWGPSTSPAGDGEWVSMLDIWGRGNAATARRRTIRRLNDLGVLRACEIALFGDLAKGVPMERMEEEYSAIRERQKTELARLLG